MPKKASYSLLVLIIWLAALHLQASSLIREETIQILPFQTVYELQGHPLISGSELIETEQQVLIKGIDYQIDYRTGKITLLSSQASDILYISYILIPPKYIQPHQLYQLRAPSDSLFQTIKAPLRDNWWQSDGKLLISGSKTFSLSFSDENAFDLKQSLYVNLSGELAEGVNISAQLSDSQTKLTPEGDSRELSSLDQVFIKVFGKSWNLAMGDLELKYESSRYLDYFSKFEGVSAQIGKQSYLQAAYSVGGGRNARADLYILEGKQGPYYLNPEGQPGSLIVIAGSESVYQNGRLLERGTDYYIDYSEGTLMFQTLVVSTDKIGVWFKYSEENYSRHSILSSGSWEALPGLTLSHRIITATDSKNKPLLYDFTQSDLDSLRTAGDSDAWGDGATLVEPGQGTYRLLLTPDGVSYYQYALSDTLADYSVAFSYVGYGEGDYEQYSNGKFRYVGSGLGDWLPQKRLIAPTSILNASLRTEYNLGSWNLGAESILTQNDRNTLSNLDDDDNLGGYLYTWIRYLGLGTNFAPSLLFDYEKRWINASLISDYSAAIGDFDLGAVIVADSLAFDSFGLKLGANLPRIIRPELSLKYLKSDKDIRQKLMRLTSSSAAWKILPRLDLKSTLAKTEIPDGGFGSGFSSYQLIDGLWAYKWIKLGGIYNLQDFEPDNQFQAKNHYQKINPYTELGNAKNYQTRISLSDDQNRSGDNPKQKSQTIGIKQLINTENHNLNLDLTHRQVSASADSAKTSYDLISLRSSDSFLMRAITIIGNYQLNQTEFFPKIRELEYVGHGIGYYDSTGVASPYGDWDYVYITSSRGSLSSERNAQLSLYLKPGNISQNDLARRISTDIILQGSEQQTGLRPDPLSYIFWPGTVFVDTLTIYGKQSYQQNLWLELMRSKINMLVSLDWQRSLDNRYQEQSHTRSFRQAAQLDFSRFGDYSFSIKAENGSEDESRYHSKLEKMSLEALAQRNLGKSSVLNLNLEFFDEHGSSTLNSDTFRLNGLGMAPGFRSVWGSRGKISGGLSLRYSFRKGDELLSFLPEKRAGLSLGASLNGVYRLNAYSTASLDYRISSYPQQKTSHQLKLEFKAEL